MTPQVVKLQNTVWQVGILPKTGASIAFGRVASADGWLDLLRPTPESDYGNSSNCSSFIMLPWSNRIKGGLLRFEGQTHQLRTTKDDGTARHGDVRGRVWTVETHSDIAVRLSIRSADYPDMNWPFAFSAWVEYALEGESFVWTLGLKNEDGRRMPAGFGHHPYFVRPQPTPVLHIPCEKQFILTDYLATGAAVPLEERVDFRQPRRPDERELNDVLTGRTSNLAGLLAYEQYGWALKILADEVFAQVLPYAPVGKPFIAVEPMSNVNDGFNLYADGVAGSGVFVLQPGEERHGVVRVVAEKI